MLPTQKIRFFENVELSAQSAEHSLKAVHVDELHVTPTLPPSLNEMIYVAEIQVYFHCDCNGANRHSCEFCRRLSVLQAGGIDAEFPF